MKPGLPVWRSLLYVPVNVEKYVDKAHTRGADCILLDLEAAVCSEVNAIAVTKVDDAAHLKRLDEIVSKLESKRGLKAGHTRFIAMIETPAAFFRMPEIALAVERNAAMDIGGEDFALENGMEPTEETLLMPKQQMIYAARAAGIMPLGYIASVASYGDREAFRRMVRRSRQFGFLGASCIHPAQVTIVNELYSPSAEEVAHAKRVIEENAKAKAAGRASFAIDGKMVDIPVVVRAERLLERHAAIQAREAAKRAAS